MPRHNQHSGDDPLREMDLILLEDVMQRWNTKADARGRAVKAGGFVLVVLVLAVVVAHAVIYGSAVMAAAKAQQPQQNGYDTTIDNRWFW
jgi:hypothetical protein